MKNWIDRLARWWLKRRPQLIPDTLVVPPGCRVQIEEVVAGTNVVNYGHVSAVTMKGAIEQLDCMEGSSIGLPAYPPLMFDTYKPSAL